MWDNTSEVYLESDYIRDYSTFIQARNLDDYEFLRS